MSKVTDIPKNVHVKTELRGIYKKNERGNMENGDQEHTNEQEAGLKPHGPFTSNDLQDTKTNQQKLVDTPRNLLYISI